MIDREKVIRGLEYCLEIEGDGACNGCPYDDDCFNENVECGEPMMRDALALLKAQEPLPAKIEGSDIIQIGRCPACGKVMVPWGASHCHECGQAVKWE